MVDEFEIGKYYKIIKDNTIPSHNGDFGKCVELMNYSNWLGRLYLNRLHPKYPVNTDDELVECDESGNEILYTSPELEKAMQEQIIKAFHVTKEDLEGNKMELENVKKTNMKEAKKQFDKERAYEEVVFAKEQLLAATNEIDRLDRVMKKANKDKKPHLEVIKRFKE